MGMFWEFLGELFLVIFYENFCGNLNKSFYGNLLGNLDGNFYGSFDVNFVGNYEEMYNGYS